MLFIINLMKIQFIEILFVSLVVSCSSHDGKNKTESLVEEDSIVRISIPDVLKEEKVELQYMIFEKSNKAENEKKS